MLRLFTKDKNFVGNKEILRNGPFNLVLTSAVERDNQKDVTRGLF